MEIAPGPLAAGLFGVPGGLLAVRYGPRLVGLAGSVVFAVGGIWWVVTTGSNPDYAFSVLPGAIIAGIGLGILLPSLSAAATLPLPPERFATGTGLMTMCRQVGLALGIAGVTAVLDIRPDVSAFHTAWLFMAACGLAGGFTLFAGGANRRPVAEHADSHALAEPTVLRSPGFEKG